MKWQWETDEKERVIGEDSRTSGIFSKRTVRGGSKTTVRKSQRITREMGVKALRPLPAIIFWTAPGIGLGRMMG